MEWSSSHQNIWAPVGFVISVQGLDDPVNELIRPITRTDELTREDILAQFPLQRLRDVPAFIPDALYVGARAFHWFFNDQYGDRPPTAANCVTAPRSSGRYACILLFNARRLFQHSQAHGGPVLDEHAATNPDAHQETVVTT